MLLRIVRENFRANKGGALVKGQEAETYSIALPAKAGISPVRQLVG